MKAVIFDFDGTMVDTESLWFEASKNILEEEFGFQLPIEKFASFIGTTDEELLQYYFEEVGDTFIKEAFTEKLEATLNEKSKDLGLRPGFLTFFQQVKNAGLKIGMATSSSRAWVEPFLRKFQILEDFDVICTRDDVEKVKPDPKLYLLALEKLAVKAEEAIAIEDSVNGSAAAIKAGIKCFVIPNPITEYLTFDEQITQLTSFEQIKL
ncbi:HAD family hydrolase [Bacillus sp. FJAT-49736]|uniref:HAD family hydrolase n=1 Tax=Bacillus sp. FJAT-49736 TaxID=2833582 RepID=UPI001BC98125|nr:HAD family hydrolase [Bacillus sp. FJAT-49736]MBS4171795.1 HAD family hydrolase [Bacillus sp. FJAT-49736]